jgi:hypothetical protein
MKSPLTRLRLWCRSEERVTNAGLVGIVIPLSGLCLNVAVPCYWAAVGQTAQRSTEWLIQWLGMNVLMVFTILLAVNVLRRKQASLWMHAAIVSFLTVYFALSLVGLLPDRWVTTFGGIYDDLRHRYIPFLTFTFLAGIASLLDAVALYSLRTGKS